MEAELLVKMKGKKSLFILFVIITSFSFCKAQDFFKAANYLNYRQPTAIVSTDEGGFIMCIEDGVILCSDSVGNEVWRKYLGTEVDEIVKANDGGYIFLCKYSWHTAGGNIIKMDHAGNLLWSKEFNRGGFFTAGIDTTIDGGYIVPFTFIENYSSKIGLLKLDVSGNLEWSKKVYQPGLNLTVNSVKQDLDGSYVLAGNVYGGSFSVDSAFPSKMLILKINELGTDTVWTKIFNGPGYDNCSSLIKTKDNNYMIGGNSDSYTLSPKATFIKFNSNGDVLMMKALVGSNKTAIANLINTKDSGYVSIGNTNSYGAGNKDIYIVKYNKNDILEWTKTYGGANDDYGRAICQSGDKLFFTGQTNSFECDPVSFIACMNNETSSCWLSGYGGIEQIIAKTFSYAGIIDTMALEYFNDVAVTNEPLVFSLADICPTLCSTVSLEVNELNSLSLYPNPANSFIFLEGLFEKKSAYTIFNSLGQVVKEGIIENKDETIDIKVLQNGMYNLKIKSISQSRTFKFVKE